MAIGDVPLTPIIDTVTGSVTEIGRIFLRTLAAAVNGLAPIDAAYWTSRAAGVLSAEVNLGALASGYLKIATAVGIATPTTVASIPQADITGLTGALAGKASLPINLATDVVGTLPAAQEPAHTGDVTNAAGSLALAIGAGKVTNPMLAGAIPASKLVGSDLVLAESQVTNLVADLAAKAPLASPALTGTPTAPTATAGTNTTQLATTAFVQAASGTGTAKLAGGNAFTGEQLMTAAANVGPGNLCVQGDDTHICITAVDRTAAQNQHLYACFNNTNAYIGGIQHSGAGVAYNATSDARLKDDAGRATDVRALRALVVHDFAWKADGRPDRGVFAQEAHAVFPRAVTAGTDARTETGQLARPWMTDYSKFVADLIVGWQQHDAEIADLRAALAALKGSR